MILSSRLLASTALLTVLASLAVAPAVAAGQDKDVEVVALHNTNTGPIPVPDLLLRFTSGSTSFEAPTDSTGHVQVDLAPGQWSVVDETGQYQTMTFILKDGQRLIVYLKPVVRTPELTPTPEPTPDAPVPSLVPQSSAPSLPTSVVHPRLPNTGGGNRP